jgi:hypothetical protein
MLQVAVLHKGHQEAVRSACSKQQDRGVQCHGNPCILRACLPACLQIRAFLFTWGPDHTDGWETSEGEHQPVRVAVSGEVQTSTLATHVFQDKHDSIEEQAMRNTAATCMPKQ